MLSTLTYKIIAHQEFDPQDAADYLAWAMEMLELGYETPHLLMLAAFEKGSSYFSLKPYVEKAVSELGLQMKSGEDGMACYCFYYIQKIAAGENVNKNLTELYKIGCETDCKDLIYDFFLLYWAWNETEYDDLDYENSYWEGANKDNIEKLVVEYAQKWIERNRDRFKLNVS